MIELPALAGLWIMFGSMLTLGAASQLGRAIVKSDWEYLNLMCGFWLLAFSVALLALADWAKPEVVFILVFSLNIWGARHLAQMFQTLKVDVKTLNVQLRKHGPTLQWFFVLVALLLMVRLARSFFPVLNWDSLNQHLPLLMERVNSGTLDPLFSVSTDRRTLWGGVLLKWVPMVLDSCGRTLILTHVVMVALGLVSFLKLGLTCGRGWQCLIAVLMFMACPDLWVYILMAGDEAWFLCFGIVWVSHYLFGHHLKCSAREVFCLMVMVALMLTVKMTAVFFVLPIICTGLVQFRKSLKVFLGAAVVSLILIVLLIGKTYNDHGMIYPLQRWSDLLSLESPPKLYQPEEIKLGREALGLVDHHDNHRAGSQPWIMFRENLSRSSSWPIGPYWFWALLALPWLIKNKKLFARNQLGLMLTIALALTLSMSSWSFSPQAITRYLLPVWFWLSVFLAQAICSSIEKNNVAYRAIKVSLFLLISYSLFIESKVLLGRLHSHSSIWNPISYWKEVCPDGPLLSHWDTLKSDQDRAFYAGSASVLMSNQGHWLAQVGNEVGWRAPGKLKSFLTRENLKWWIVASSAIKIDPIYQALSHEAVTLGLLEKVATLPSGVIYRVKDDF
jgi:hypothetical protein